MGTAILHNSYYPPLPLNSFLMTEKELIKLLNDKQQYKEIWLHSIEGQRICALINNDVGFLMYLRYEGDAGFTSRNFQDTSKDNIEFLLSNGQKDLYPKKWTYPIDTIKEAMLYFLMLQERSPLVHWQDDSMPDE